MIKTIGDTTLIHGDCVAWLNVLPASSIDAIVCDPPYGLEFMGKGWDGADGFRRSLNANDTGRDNAFGRLSKRGPEYRAGALFQEFSQTWAEACLRVLKPGGHLLAFGGTRTWHRLAVAIEDAGFEIRDSITWIYGSGFPKSRDVSEAMDAFLAGDHGDGDPTNPDVLKVTAFLRAARDAAGWSNTRIDALFGTTGMAGHWTTQASQPRVPSLRQWEILKQQLGFGDDVDEIVQRLASTERPEDWGSGPGDSAVFLSTLGDDDTRHAGGWGTALKPASEPIVVARKAVVGSTTSNVRQYGTGALNVDGCRVGDDGRWPANVAVDERTAEQLGDRAKFFPVFHYCPKAPTKERPKVDGVTHPTVKPLALMRWLVRLVTPPGGTVLDPFAGSGTTLEAAALEGFPAIGIEREAAYLPLIETRLARVRPVDESEAVA